MDTFLVFLFPLIHEVCKVNDSQLLRGPVAEGVLLSTPPHKSLEIFEALVAQIICHQFLWLEVGQKGAAGPAGEDDGKSGRSFGFSRPWICKFFCSFLLCSLSMGKRVTREIGNTHSSGCLHLRLTGTNGVGSLKTLNHASCLQLVRLTG